MRKINLADYEFGGQTFQVRPSLVAILFNEDKLDGREVIRRDELALKVEEHVEDEILLEENEWAKFVTGLNSTDLKPHGRSVVRFVKRILDAPQVDVKER